MNDTVPVAFDLQELWLLHSLIRHEMPQSEQWRFAAPADLELNEQIIFGILLCEDEKQTQAVLLLCKRDCLVIDYLVRADMKSANGVNIGKPILLKTFRARHQLAGGVVATASDPATTRKEVDEKMSEFETYRAKQARRRRKTQDA